MDEWQRFQLFRSMLPPLEELSHVPREKLTQALVRMYESMRMLQENMRRFRENPDGTGGGKIYGMTQLETQSTLDQLLGEILIYQEILETLEAPGVPEPDRSPIGDREITQEQLMNYYRTGNLDTLEVLETRDNTQKIEIYVHPWESKQKNLPLAKRTRVLITPDNLDKQYPQASKFYNWVKYNSTAGFSDLYLYYELSSAVKRVLQFSVYPAPAPPLSLAANDKIKNLMEEYQAWGKMGRAPLMVEVYHKQECIARLNL